MKKVTSHFIWAPFLVKVLEDKHDITSVAKRDGMGEEPSTDSSGSVLEGEIKQECYSYISDHESKLSDHLHNIEENQNQLSSYLTQNHFNPIVNKCDADYHAKINEKEIKLIDHTNNYKTFKEEQTQFARYHQLSRQPNFATTKKTFKALGLILFLFIAEVILNASMLSGALVGGQVEAGATATSIAFLNVIASGLMGYYIFKNTRHLEKGKKILYGFLSALYVIFIVYINACLGAYRSLSGKLFEQKYVDGQELSAEQVDQILTTVITPWTNDVSFSLMGIVLSCVGITFAFISTMDGFTYNDTYPGYGNVGKKVDYFKNQRRLVFTSCAEEIPKLFKKTNTDLQNVYSNIRKNELNHWNDNANLIQKEFVTYEQKVNYAQDQSWHIIKEYRENNKRVRKTKAPSFFNEKFSIPENIKDPKKALKGVKDNYMDDATREAKQLKLSQDVDQKFKTAEKEIEDIETASVAKMKELHEKYNTN